MSRPGTPSTHELPTQEQTMHSQMRNIEIPRPTGFKVPTPDTYEGKRDMNVLYSYLISLEGYFSFYPGLSEQQKVALAMMNLRKEALIWATRTEGFTSFANFKDRLTLQFQPSDHQRVTRTKLKNLRQKAAVSSYIAEFLELSRQVEPKFHESHLIDLFTDGLKPSVKKHVIIQNPDSLENAFRIAIRTDDIEFSMRKNIIASSAVQYNFKTPRSNNARATDDPMQLDNIQNKLQKLTTEERSRLAREGKCFRCRKPGHVSKDCKAFAKAMNNIATQAFSNQ